FNIEGLKSGVYFVIISTEDGITSTHKLVKK
ncbi:MAG: T9SS type A sorting domain-containing protein, partial [Ekhidna sp.]|nr:T9SS type A sorting domain-containing protein [Ekhidna sp.]